MKSKYSSIFTSLYTKRSSEDGFFVYKLFTAHVDQVHIHNHIIFNTTSSQDLKKFRWQKGTPELLRNISDKISDYHQAKVLPPLDRSSYSKYQKYLASDAVRPEIQKRMNFLLRH
ncbi:relaxase/mobilization nuclease domain-containing protein [Lactococcus formosensis]|uniref:relaxase/mobilization nuclease domain-containing protein n=1 Tax=Lactococcus formosensis TaxID=1281486 RepID=UPI003D6FCDBC